MANIKDLKVTSLANLVSFVTQDNFLFQCSLLENIRLGNPNATDEEVKAAARAACCEEFILKLPNGYNTTAGEAGKRLSGGERQRIAIARMMLKNAPIVILDEATAFTDPENEDKLQTGKLLAMEDIEKGWFPSAFYISNRTTALLGAVIILWMLLLAVLKRTNI